MDDLIERDALMKKICGNECGSVCDEECEKVMCNYYDYIMDAPAVNRWIPCSERMPYIGVDVIVYVRTWRDQKVQFGYRYSEETWSVANIGVSNDEISFWMPLPEPPEKE